MCLTTAVANVAIQNQVHLTRHLPSIAIGAATQLSPILARHASSAAIQPRIMATSNDSFKKRAQVLEEEYFRKVRANKRQANNRRAPGQIQRRNFTTSRNCQGRSRMHGAGGDFEKWPRTKMNTVLNICPQGTKMVVERLGKMHSIESSGWFIAVPFIDQVSYVVDMREKALEITPQAAITKDNVSIDVSGNVFLEFTDPQRAAYGSFNPLYNVRQHAQSAMRAAIGHMELDAILHDRNAINNSVLDALVEASEPWGMQIKRYEITDITPDRFILEAMDKQAAAERSRREQVLSAEGDKRQAVLQSEGVKIKLTNESEGERIKVQNEAEAEKMRMVLEAEGASQSSLLRAQAQAQSIELIADAMNVNDGMGVQAAQLALAHDYVSMYGEMGAQSNTMIFSDKPGDLNALLAQAAAVVNVVPGSAAAEAADLGVAYDDADYRDAAAQWSSSQSPGTKG